MSLKLPTVSIIVSAYQGARYLPATINSILQQTYTNFEVLIFNDDYSQTRRWFKGRQDSRLKFILQENLGISQTFNQGILEAQGKYISFINAGDLWHPLKLQKQVVALEYSPDLGLVYSWLILIDHHGKSTGKIVKPHHAERIKSQIEAGNQVCLSSVMVRRSCFDRIGLFDHQLKAIPAWDLWLRLSHRYQLRKIAEPLVYYRKLQSNLVKNWLTVETDLQTTIEKAYTDASPEIFPLKCCSYAYASLFLANNVLHHQDPDPAIANNYCRQALQHYPLIGFSPEFIKVRLAVITLYCLKSDRFHRLLMLIETTEGLLRSTIHKLKEYGQSVLDWMLEEEDLIIFWKNSKVERQGKDY